MTEDAEIVPGDNRSGTIMVADRDALVHEHSRNLDFFMSCHERELFSSHYWSDHRYNYLYVSMGEATVPGLLRIPDIRFCQNPRAARLEFQEIPDMVSTITFYICLLARLE